MFSRMSIGRRIEVEFKNILRTQRLVLFLNNMCVVVCSAMCRIQYSGVACLGIAGRCLYLPPSTCDDPSIMPKIGQRSSFPDTSFPNNTKYISNFGHSIQRFKSFIFMAQPSRSPASPPSSSSGRLPSISRPDWPWAAPRSYSHSSQQSSGSPRPSLQGSNLQNEWDPRPSTSSSSSSNAQLSGTPSRYISTPKPNMSSATPFRPTDTTRQWTFIVNIELFCGDKSHLSPVGL